MSVLIKGMKMPKSCVDCILYDLDSEQCPIYAIYKEDFSEKRFEKCPLIEVPTPHGRLIDADALKLKKYHSTENMENAVAVAEIDWMPTVIGAEN